ncbi:LacI family DNA-binding transcriptional regulator [Virgibacillus chiguensis]|uniref:LacI family transcriptional regulator n=1 Tax=Virgibacillus chiguensis TaxID=411959 RepID=A0A1M5PT73_9BACI|nr:LacI family DNA-binding transcriptional regulator [Virgibacillus chiguensis]SHH05075.1 LacI family transcriptional regulator [Virgibacillus chiguensis]
MLQINLELNSQAHLHLVIPSKFLVQAKIKAIKFIGDVFLVKVTIKDIAKKAGVSPSSVSLVLNDRPSRISDQKKAEIKQIAKELNYTANQIARSLVTKQTKTFGLIIPDIENIFFSSLAKHIEMQCRMHGYTLIIVNSNDQFENDIALLDLLLSRAVEGIFLIPASESWLKKPELIEKLKQLTVPYILLDRVFSDLSCDKVWFDNEYGAYIAVKYLLENGHRKIACIASSSFINGQFRLNGYLRALKEFNIPIDYNNIVTGDYKKESGYLAGQKIINKDVTAIFITNDMMALGFIHSIYEKNKKIPDDYSVISYDNTIYPYLFGVELSSVKQDVKKLSETAFKQLFQKIQKKDTVAQNTCLQPELIARTSVKTIHA